MLAVVLAALRSRRSATAALWLLAALVTAGAVAAPCYLLAAEDRVVAWDVTDASAAQRAILLTQETTEVGTDQTAIDRTRAVLDRALTLPHATEVEGLRVDGSPVVPARASQGIVYRDGVCDHVRVTGACPAALDEAMISRSYAAAAGLGVGDPLSWPAATTGHTIPRLRIVGLYDPIDATEAYWPPHLFAATESAGRTTADAVFVTEATIRAHAISATCDRMLLLNPGTIATLGPDRLADRVADLDASTSNHDYRVAEDVGPLVARIDADHDILATAIPVLAVEVVVFGWFALYLVLRAIAVGRRPDVGLALLRGSRRRTLWAVFLLENALPVVAALPVGAAAGVAGAWLLTGPVPAASRPLAAAEAGVAIGAVLVGALVAAAVGQRRAHRTAVPDLLRDTPPRRRGWRADTVDVVLVVAAAVAIVQARLSAAAPPRAGAAPAGNAALPAGIAAVAPMLVAIAVALVVARLLAPAAVRFVAWARRRGRPAVLLTAAHLARRHGLDRVFVVPAVAVALAAGAVVSWRVAGDAQAVRAVQQLGADRVLQVRGASVPAALAATRAADPAGRYAMAVVLRRDPTEGARVLAVDSSRLGRVLATGRAGAAGPGWPDGDRIAEALRAASPPPPRLADGPVDLTLDAAALPAKPVVLRVDVADDTGVGHRLLFGPLLPGPHDYSATLDGCDPGCDVAALAVMYQQDPDTGPSNGVDVTVGMLGGRPPDDPLDWRTSANGNQYGPALSRVRGGGRGDSAGLRVALPTNGIAPNFAFDPRVYPLDAPLPLPAVLAGALPKGATVGIPTLSPFADLTVPLRVVATASVLPQLGTQGALVDLVQALRLDRGLGTDGIVQIWLRADTPASVVTALRGSGLVIVSDTTAGAAEAALRHQSPQAVVAFGLAAGLIALLAAVTALALVAGVERRARGVELAALRRQGLPRRVVGATAAASYGVFAATAVVAGLAAVALARLLGVGGTTVFMDGWATPPLPHASVLGWVAGGLVVAVPLAAIAGRAARRLARAVAAGERGGQP